MLPSPFSKPKPPPAPPKSPSVDDEILKHLAHIDRILTAFYNVVLFVLASGAVLGMWAMFGR